MRKPLEIQKCYGTDGLFLLFVFLFLFSRGHATLHLAVSIRPSVGPVTFLNCERFSHYCSCPSVRDWIAVYPTLFSFHETFFLFS